MCVQLSHTGRIIIPGNQATIKTKRGDQTMTWNPETPNARMESLDRIWKPGGWELGTMEIDAFYEAGSRFNFAKSREIGVVHFRGVFSVITEPANRQVAKVHPRQPCFENLLKLLAA